MRRAAKLDGNHEEVVSYLRDKGWSVYSTAPLGHGFPDIIAALGHCTALVEIKDPKSSRGVELQPDQVKFRENWNGLVITAMSGEDAHKQLQLASGLTQLRA